MEDIRRLAQAGIGAFEFGLPVAGGVRAYAIGRLRESPELEDRLLFESLFPQPQTDMDYRQAAQRLMDEVRDRGVPEQATGRYVLQPGELERYRTLADNLVPDDPRRADMEQLFGTVEEATARTNALVPTGVSGLGTRRP